MELKFSFKFGILLCLIFGAPLISYGEYSGVYDIYYETTKFPESADALIAKNKHFFDERFFSCLSEVRNKSMWGSVKWGKICNQNYADPTQWAGCNSNDEAGKMMTWTREMEAATRGETKWSSTLNYMATMTGKRGLGARNYENIIDQAAPSTRPILICE